MIQQMLKGLQELNGKLLEVDGEVYAAAPDLHGWWVWRFFPGSQEHFVDVELGTCTCPATGRCKHLRALT